MFANGSLLITQVRARSTGVYKCVGHGQRGKTLVLKATLRLAGEVWGGDRVGSGSQSSSVTLELCDNIAGGQYMQWFVLAVWMRGANSLFKWCFPCE